MKADRGTKSNRAQSDYFELLVTQYICHVSGVTFSYSNDLSEIVEAVLDKEGGKSKLAAQNKRFQTIKPYIDKILEEEVKAKGKVINVIWIGRKLIKMTTSDVDAKHITLKLTRFSVKSIEGIGTGTLKNIGMRTLKSRLGVDFKKEYEEMWSRFRKHLSIGALSKAALKDKANRDAKLLKWVEANGRVYQKQLNGLCLRAFNNLTLEEKTDFINFLTDCHDEDLYVIIANEKGVIVYRPKDKREKTIRSIKAEAYEDEAVGYFIMINGVPAYRVQTNNTNGLGRSPFCQRVFLV